MLKVTNPYGVSDTYKSGSDIVDWQNNKSSSKAKARYPSAPLSANLDNPTTGQMKRRALTPGTTPVGS